MRVVVTGIMIAVLLLALPGCSSNKETAALQKDAMEALDACHATARKDFLQGLSYYERKEYASADAMFEKIRKTCPLAPYGWHGSFIIALVDGNGQKAEEAARKTIEHLQQVQEKRPALWDGYLEFLYGVCLAVGIKDSGQARNHYQRSCELKEGRGCSNFGKLLEPSDSATAYKYYTKGCSYGYGRACTNKGVMEETTLKKPDQALESYRQGCTLRHATGCRNAALLLRAKGNGQDAGVLLQRACELGDTASCERQKAKKE